jgi:arylsulfatase A-like enzyme
MRIPYGPLSRRGFLEGVGATLGGATLSQVLNSGAAAGSQGNATYDPGSPRNAVAWKAPQKLTNPNILIIMVDQMRWPQWVSQSQMNVLNSQILPNIFGRLRDASYVFEQYYTAATNCSAARGTLLSGLYAAQTAVFIDGGSSRLGAQPPPLVPTFPTWGEAVAALNSAYQNNVWWFGKWHLCNCTTSQPLLGYGFNTRTYPGGAAANPSPNGAPNEGTDGGSFNGGPVYASDADIAGDFIGWLRGQTPTPNPPASPWCATVSLINPHDITQAPAWLQSSPFPPTGVPLRSLYFPPPAFPPASGAPALYSSPPAPWNYENLQKVTDKPALQYAFQTAMNKAWGQVTNWVTFLNQYYWLQNYVDQQVGLVLNALNNSAYAANTIVVFLADHGEYSGSHGLHDKGDAAYDESIRVPLYVHFPGQTGSIVMNQMCSSVDFFGLAADLAAGGGGAWQSAYPSLASRQSIWNFLYNNTPETRIAPALGIPYIFHTFDDTTVVPGFGNSHIVCLRTKANPSDTAQPGAKLAIYSEWAPCTTIPGSVPPDYEFYDYNPATTNNVKEMGNDYLSPNPTTQATIAEYLSQLGSWGPPATGLIASELDPPLIGNGTDGYPLSQAQATARQNYFEFLYGAGKCTT